MPELARCQCARPECHEMDWLELGKEPGAKICPELATQEDLLCNRCRPMP